MKEADVEEDPWGRAEVIGRLLMLSTDVRVRSGTSLHDAARAMECVALLMFHKQERSVLDFLIAAVAQTNLREDDG